MNRAEALQRADFALGPVLLGLSGLLACPQAAEAQTVPSIQDWERQLAERDAIIAELLRRVQQLEQRVGLEIGEASIQVSAPAAPENGASRAEGTDGAAATAQASPPAAPGQFEVDEEAAERALERSLVQTGVLLLPFGQVEVEPSFSYTRREVDAPSFFTLGGTTFIAEDEVRRNEFQWNLGLRIGLPFDSQLELDLPYNLVDESTVTRVGFAEQNETSGTGSGLGDLSVGLAKTLVREGRWWPDVVARVTWDSKTGQSTDDGVVLNGGFNELSGSVNLTKRQDPLAFVGGAFYETTFDENDVDPGDEFGFSVGAFLAASPETSLRVILSQSFVDELKIDNVDVNGSDQVVSVLSVGASAILGRGVFLDLAADVGLTDEAPDYGVSISLPIRFNVPIPAGF